MNTEGFITVALVGGHRGRETSLRNFAAAALEFSVPISILAIDSIIARRTQTALAAVLLGLHAESGPASLQEARREGLLDGKPWCYVALDKPAAIADALEIAAVLRIGVVVNAFLEFASWPMIGFRAVVAPGDTETGDQVRLLFRHLESMTLHTGSAAVFGAGARPENMLIEPLVRGTFFGESARAIVKGSLQQDPEIVPVAITFDGVTDVPTVLVDARAGVQDSKALGAAMMAKPPFPIIPGTQIALIQIPASEELILRKARLRGVDHAMRVGEARRIDTTYITDAIRNADRNVVSSVNPVKMTD